MIRVAIVDDHPVVRAGTAAIVEQAPDLALAGTASTLEELRPLLQGDSVDVLLLDLRLGQQFGLGLFESAARKLPAIVVVATA
jgi:DNA-binding NarL/FixJ family response regulator